MVFVSIFAGFVPVSDLGHMVSIGTLFAFSLVCIGVIVMRKLIQMQKEVSECLCSCIPYCRCYYLSNFDGWLTIESWRD
jgi:APA family basic amino acid/polyamine antiporter